MADSTVQFGISLDECICVYLDSILIYYNIVTDGVSQSIVISSPSQKMLGSIIPESYMHVSETISLYSPLSSAYASTRVSSYITIGNVYCVYVPVAPIL